MLILMTRSRYSAELSATLQSYWGAFAADGKPSLQKRRWPRQLEAALGPAGFSSSASLPPAENPPPPWPVYGKHGQDRVMVLRPEPVLRNGLQVAAPCSFWQNVSAQVRNSLCWQQRSSMAGSASAMASVNLNKRRASSAPRLRFPLTK
eukprot:COSAG01_NODE_3011_length_6725_cov_71.575158_7_plen_149_part_00